jgi:hypothetical protein
MQKGDHSAPRPADQDSTLIGGIRLIILERVGYEPPSVSVSRDSYLKIEKVFHLPAVSLLALANANGICSSHEVYSEEMPSKLKRIGVSIIRNSR